MATQALTPEEAGDVAQQFHDMAVLVGNFRLDHAIDLSDVEQFTLQNQQMLCLQYSNSFISQGLSLEQSTLAQALTDIKDATNQAKQAITNVADVDKGLQLVSALAVLGASVASMNISAIESGVKGVLSAAAASTGTTSASGSGTAGAAATTASG